MSIIDRFKRFIPTPEKIKSNRFLRVFGRFLEDPRLWQLNRHSVPMACSIGLFVTYIPFLGHMLLATVLAILFRANLPVSLALVWVVNPITIIPLFTLAFSVGALVFGLSLEDFSIESIDTLWQLWQPFVVGCLITGTALAILSNIGVRLAWRYVIVKKWQERSFIRHKKLASIRD